MKENTIKQAEVEKLHTLWNESCNAIDFEDIDTEADWNLVKQRIGSHYATRHQAIPLRSYIIRIAAILIVAIGLSIGVVKIIQYTDNQQSFYTKIESSDLVKSVELPDGSEVTLNINSSIWYNNGFNHESRDIILQGEAYFEVEHNPELSFKVYAGNSVVEVKGTHFSVCEDSSFVRVVVLFGSVSVQSAENAAVSTIVAKDESGFIFPDNTIEKRPQVNINNISWKTGQLVFYKTPVENALQDIAHHFHKSLAIETNLNDSLTAQFTEQTLDDILEELRIITSLSINHTDNIIVVKQ
ncbi:MAG: FecR domain-containing protein [Bacteroidales bacterium]|nr:FecR domain-containing protein [Bacteroidales bacterium]